MATGKKIAPHETFELHELLTFKNVCATKSSVMSGLVQDQELKSLLQQDYTASQGQIKELRGLLQSSEYATGGTGTDGGTGITTH